MTALERGVEELGHWCFPEVAGFLRNLSVAAELQQAGSTLSITVLVAIYRFNNSRGKT